MADPASRRSDRGDQRLILGERDRGHASHLAVAVGSQAQVRTVDVGNPMLSMHSIRELGGAKDPAMMTRVLTSFYGCPDPGGP